MTSLRSASRATGQGPATAELHTGPTAADPAVAGASEYTCPGRTMPQPKGAPFEGYVACYRAGHRCPPKVAITTEDETHRTTSWRCPCCGDHGPMMCIPKEWDGA